MADSKIVVKCDECGSEDVVKAGRGWRVVSLNPKFRKQLQQYRCKGCGKIFVNRNDIKED